MSENKPNSAASSLDPADDAPEWTDEMFEIAEHAIGGKVIRPATGYLGPNGVVIDRFREGGLGWQGRINEALRKAVGL